MLRTILRGAVLAAPAAILLACLATHASAVQRAVTIYQIQDTTLVGRVTVGSTDTVTAIGVITGADTKPPGLGYYIQNTAGGPFSGVLVFTGGQNQFADSSLSRGDLVQVTGRVTEFGDETEIISRSGNGFNGVPVVVKLGTAAIPSPIVLPSFGHLAQTASYNIAEKYEGVLVSLPAAARSARYPIFQNASTTAQFTNQFLAVEASVVGPIDSVRINGETLPNPSYAGAPLNSAVPSCQGIGVQRSGDGGYGLQIRDGADIVAFTPPVLLNAFATSNTNIRLIFDKALDATTAQTVGNYSRTLTLKSIQAATLFGTQEVDLTTTTQPQIGGEAERVRAQNVQSALNVAMPAPLTEAFRAGITPITQIQTNLPVLSDTSKYINQQVTFRGIVQARDESLYYIQDGTSSNPSSGMAVFSPPITLDRGDDVTISGVILEFGSLSQLTEMSGPDYVNVNASLQTEYPPVVVASPGAIGRLTPPKPFPGERYEAMLVEMQNVTVVRDTLPNGQYLVWGSGAANDTARVDDTMYRHLYVEGSILNVRGMVNDAFGQFSVNPRNQADYDSLATVGVEPIADLNFRIRSVWPTPVSFANGGHATLSFTLPSRGAVSARMFDLAGRLVAVPFTERIMEAGPQTVQIDGRSLSGSSLRSGIFFLQLQLGNRLATGKVVVTN